MGPQSKLWWMGQEKKGKGDGKEGGREEGRGRRDSKYSENIYTGGWSRMNFDFFGECYTSSRALEPQLPDKMCCDWKVNSLPLYAVLLFTGKGVPSVDHRSILLSTSKEQPRKRRDSW